MNHAFNNNQWYYLTATWGTGEVKIYINGELIGSNSSTTIQYNNPKIGIGTDWDSHSFPGQIDDTGIYNRALTSDEVSHLYNSGKSLHDTGFKHRLTGISDSVR